MKTSKLRTNFKGYLLYLLVYCFIITAQEVLLRLHVCDSVRESGLFFLFFVPAEASFFSLFSGFYAGSKKRNRFLMLIPSIIISVYYIAQLIYFNSFGSLFSVALIKMGGEAVGNFGWAIKKILLESIPVILVSLCISFLPTAFFICLKKDFGHISFSFRPIIIVLTCLIWLGGICGIKAFGTERTSPYYVFSNPYSDTDTSSEKLGALTTTIIESGTYILGISDETHVTSLNPSAVAVSIPEASGEALPNDSVVSHTQDNLPASNTENSENKVASETSENNTVEITYHINENIDFEALKASTEDERLIGLCDYFMAKEALPYNDYTGIFEGYNLIYICGESFGPYALNEKVTPLLTKMSQNGIVLPNYYTSYKNTTTNGEFAFLTSLWPDVSRFAADGNDVGSFAKSSTKYMPYGLGHIAREAGRDSFAYHGYISSYYKRGDSWPNLGFETIKFMNEGMTFVNYWSPADLELVMQSVDDYIDKDRFVTYYMTYSGHGDYTTDTYMYIKNHEAVIDALGDEAVNYSDSEISFLCGNYELELAMEYIVDRLEKAGKLNNTLIVLAGDHIPYYFATDEMKDLAAKANMDFDVNFEMYRSTCIMYNSGLEAPIINENYCCNVDVLPTILNLLGLEYDSRLIMGIDIFAKTPHRARLYNGNFLTEYVRYNASKGTAVWSDKALSFTDWQKEVYLNNMIEYTEGEYAASLALMDSDFYSFALR